MHNEYAVKQEFLLQRKLSIMNMLESKTTWCRESFLKKYVGKKNITGAN
jgi:hypothetical protein